MMTVPQLFPNSPSQIVAFVTQRKHNFRLPERPPFLTHQQKEYLSAALPVPFKGIVNIRQVHGHQILVVDDKNCLTENEIFEADGIVTNKTEIALVIRTADCLPVFIYDTRSKCIGLVHAGWKGSQHQVALQALKAMQKNWDSRPEDCFVSFGPAIRVCCYEVGDAIQSIFPQETVSRQGHWFLNLPLAHKNQLIRYGVLPENIFDCGICTCCHHEYFSYRREGQKAGRNLSLLMMT